MLLVPDIEEKKFERNMMMTTRSNWYQVTKAELCSMKLERIVNSEVLNESQESTIRNKVFLASDYRVVNQQSYRKVV